MEKIVSRKALFKILCIFFVLAVTLYLITTVYRSNLNYNIFNFFAYIFSLVLVVIGIKDFYKNGIGLYNVFLMIFFSILAINCTNLSGIQKPKTMADLYYFFFGAVLFALILRVTDRIQIKEIYTFKIIKADIVALIILLVFWVLQIYVFHIKGIRIFTSLLVSYQSNMFTIPGISGLLLIMSWFLLMLLTGLKSRWLRVAIVLSTLIVPVLNANRTMFIRTALFLIFYYIYSYKKQVFQKKNIIRIFILACLLLILFAAWGNYREKTTSSWSEDRVGNLLKSSSNSSVVNWFYGYTAINFDVLKQKIIETEHTYSFKALFIPIIRLLDGSEAAVEVSKSLGSVVGNGLHGFNAPTFLAGSVRELGIFYFIEVIILGGIVFFMGILCKATGFKGGYLFLITLGALTVFGNYYSDITSFFSIISGIAVSTFLRFEKERVSADNKREILWKGMENE